LDSLLILIRFLKEMVGWKVSLDIFLMAILIFFIYRTFRGLGTWRVLLGILTAVMIFMLASLLELEGMSWVYSNLSQVAVLGIIIIFQPELRKVFERTVSLKRNRNSHKGSELSMLISNAVFALSQQKRGAILVLPGKEPIKQWLSGGFSMNAEPSFPLIMSIFDPNSPGHDGALIIQEGKFTWFGIRLPNSKSGRLPTEFGTRHHAAMGLSEMTDALVIMVSEETGQVKTFFRGRIGRSGDEDQLCLNIDSHWEKTSSYLPKASLKKHKWELSLEICLSAILAFIFWAFLATSHAQIFERSLVVPIEYTSIPQHLALVGDKTTQINLHLAGPKTDLDAFTANRSTIKIDLSKAMAGKQTLAVNEENIHLPKKVRILETEPSSLSISLEEILIKELIIKPQLIGNLPRGFELISVELTPMKVQVLSPASASKRGEVSLITTPIYLEGIKKDTTLFCKIIAPPHIQPPDKRWPDVQVQIKVKR